MSEATIVLPKETAQALVELTGEARADVALVTRHERLVESFAWLP